MDNLKRLLLLDLRDVVESDYEGMEFDDIEQIANDISYQWIIGENRAKKFCREYDIDILEAQDICDNRFSSYEELVNGLVSFIMLEIVQDLNNIVDYNATREPYDIYLDVINYFIKETIKAKSL